MTNNHVNTTKNQQSMSNVPQFNKTIHLCANTKHLPSTWTSNLEKLILEEDKREMKRQSCAKTIYIFRSHLSTIDTLSCMCVKFQSPLYQWNGHSFCCWTRLWDCHLPSTIYVHYTAIEQWFKNRFINKSENDSIYVECKC